METSINWSFQVTPRAKQSALSVAWYMAMMKLHGYAAIDATPGMMSSVPACPRMKSLMTISVKIVTCLLETLFDNLYLYWKQ